MRAGRITASVPARPAPPPAGNPPRGYPEIFDFRVGLSRRVSLPAGLPLGHGPEQEWMTMANPCVELKVLDPRLKEWGLPQYQSEIAAAIDLHACLDAPLELLPGAPAVLIPSGIAMHMADPGLAALVLPRSGLGHRKGLVLGNLVGLIDPDIYDTK
jgi:dUTPase-like protein